MIPKNQGRREFLKWIFALGIFWGGVSHYAATPLIVALSPGHSDITRFRPWSPGNHLDRTKKIPNIAQMTGTIDVFTRVQAFWDPFRRELPHVQIIMNNGPMDPTHSREMPSCAAINLAEIGPFPRLPHEFDE